MCFFVVNQKNFFRNNDTTSWTPAYKRRLSYHFWPRNQSNAQVHRRPCEAWTSVCNAQLGWWNVRSSYALDDFPQGPGPWAVVRTNCSACTNFSRVRGDLREAGKRLSQCPLGPTGAFLLDESDLVVGKGFVARTSMKWSSCAGALNRSSCNPNSTRKNA